MSDQAIGYLQIERGPDGKAPTACQLWRAGENRTDNGSVLFSPRSAELCMAAYRERGMPLVFDYEHESTIPLEERRGPEVGIASASRAILEMRGTPEAPEPWATDIRWTPRARAQIESGERTQISPLVIVDKGTREVVRILNVALCLEGATHRGVLLAAARRLAKGHVSMDPMDALLAAIESGDKATAHKIVDEMMGVAPPEGAPPAPGAEDMRAKFLSAFKAMLASSRAGNVAPLAASSQQAAFASKFDEMMAAFASKFDVLSSNVAKRLDVLGSNVDLTTNRSLIAAHRDLFTPAAEQEYLKASPADTERYIRVAMATRAPAGTSGAVQATGDGGPADKTFGLTEVEMQTAARAGISFEAFSKSKTRRLKGRRKEA